MADPATSCVASPARGRASIWRSSAFGVACVLFAMVVLTTSVAVARAGLTRHLAPADLLALRFGIAGLLFLPSFVAQVRRAPRRLLALGIPLSFAHGWGMAACALSGLQFAPASHASALGPGCVPLAVALVALAAFGRRPTRGQAIGIAAICAGVGALIVSSYRGLSTAHALRGDLFFLGGAALAGCYFVYVERHAISARLGNALVMVLSGVVVVPTYLLFCSSRIPTAPWREVVLQALFQGVLMSLAYLAVHHAVLLLGSTRVSVLLAFVPVTTIATGRAIAGDRISTVEAAAIALVSAGVAVGTRFRASAPPAAARAPGGPS